MLDLPHEGEPSELPFTKRYQYPRVKNALCFSSKHRYDTCNMNQDWVVAKVINTENTGAYITPGEHSKTSSHPIRPYKYI